MTDPIEKFLGGYPLEVQTFCQELRAMVKSAMPEAVEVLYARDNHLGYSFSGLKHERIVYLVPMKNYVRLGFMWGGQLPDPEQLLEGTGKRMRHVKVRSIEEARQPGLKRLVESAWEDEIWRRRNKKR